MFSDSDSCKQKVHCKGWEWVREGWKVEVALKRRAQCLLGLKHGHKHKLVQRNVLSIFTRRVAAKLSKREAPSIECECEAPSINVLSGHDLLA